MSSIAYVTDPKMIEYHRLCGNRTINFWRLSSQKRFSDFRKGDLLFFYTRSAKGKRKGFVGYAHYESSQKMSLRSMWNKYGRNNGYDSKEQLEEAVRKASRDGQIPAEMSCLTLKDVVFFISPVYPEDAGIQISPQLESYCYLDQENPQATVRILQLAEKIGIDVWSTAQSYESESIFREDEIRHRLAQINRIIGNASRSRKEDQKARSLAREFVKNDGWEMIRSSQTDCLRITGDKVTIAIPFVHQVKNRDERRIELFGRIALYKLYIAKTGLDLGTLRFEAIQADEDQPDIIQLLEEFNHE